MGMKMANFKGELIEVPGALASADKPGKAEGMPLKSLPRPRTLQQRNQTAIAGAASSASKKAANVTTAPKKRPAATGAQDIGEDKPVVAKRPAAKLSNKSEQANGLITPATGNYFLEGHQEYGSVKIERYKSQSYIRYKDSSGKMCLLVAINEKQSVNHQARPY